MKTEAKKAGHRRKSMKDADKNLSGGEREPGVCGCPGNQEAFFQEDSVKCL